MNLGEVRFGSWLAGFNSFSIIEAEFVGTCLPEIL